MKQLILPLLGAILLSCGNDPLPKPNAYLRLEYPEAIYQKTNLPLPFSFEKNKLAKPISSIKTSKSIKGVNVTYPALKATVYLTYKTVNNNLDSLLRDAQNLTQKHTIKADEIMYNTFENNTHHTYGMFYEIGGDAASQAQFYLTDSSRHFVSGSLYFYAKPNYDSIFPASEYLKNDIRHLMETLEWNN